MSIVTLSHPTRKLQGSIKLPGSKSESNRALILRALSGNSFEIENLSEARDTQNLLKTLASTEVTADVMDAGTSMRFLTAYYAVRNEHKIVTGSERMRQRPIAPLVDALVQIGFDVRYADKEGFAPIEIIPLKSLNNLFNEVDIPGNISSQFTTALLLIAPFLPEGLKVNFTTKLSSAPYIDMTLQMLKHFGVKYVWQGNSITVQPGKIEGDKYTVGADWSAASYWYSMAFLADEADIFLEDLKSNWIQGDRIVADWMKRYSVSTDFNQGGAVIKNVHSVFPTVMKLDYEDNPDLAQTFAAMFAAKNIASTFTGVDSLKIKETDRIEALRSELQKCGYRFDYSPEFFFYQLRGNYTQPTQPITTYNDHRMAMSFAPLALLGEVQIENPDVVEKSYPGFWKDLETVGFTVTRK